MSNQKNLKESFLESFKDRNNKMDHKRLTVFVSFVLLTFITVTVLFRKQLIPNNALLETIIYVLASIILGGMGFSMIKKPTLNLTQNDTTEQEFQSGGDASEPGGS
jgi:hypothetical protein